MNDMLKMLIETNDKVKLLRDFGRMCKSYGESTCDACPLVKEGLAQSLDVCQEVALLKHPDKSVEIIEAWAKEHPEKTYIQDLLEKFPRMALSDKGIPYPCKAYLYDNANKCTHENGNCKECWNAVMEDANYNEDRSDSLED